MTPEESEDIYRALMRIGDYVKQCADEAHQAKLILNDINQEQMRFRRGMVDRP